ncbi:hypothetical protein NCCP2716_12930 [Sporosarcina sp. NCCP-2716]|nr:hypothetical protein NCCP2716_12930 [Sporosarcina sp. NCCP-2716]
MDENQLAVTAAEAGVDFYKTYFSNLYFQSVPVLEKKANQLINDQLREIQRPGSTQKSVDFKSVQRDINNMLYNILNEEVKEINRSPVKIQISNSYTFEPEKFTIEEINEGSAVIINSSISGVFNNNVPRKKLSYLQEFITISFDLAPGNDNGPGSIIGNVDFTKLYPNTSVGNHCSASSIQDKTCYYNKNDNVSSIQASHVYFPSGYAKANNGNIDLQRNTLYSNMDFIARNMNDVQDTKVYINGNFEAENMNKLMGSEYKVNGSFKAKNMNDLQHTKMYINGSYRAGNMNDIEHSFIYTKGPFTADMINSAQYSTLNIDGVLTLNKHLELQASTFAVNGNANIGGKLNLKKNSNIPSRFCIAGDLTVDGDITIDSYSRIYLSGKVKTKHSNDYTSNKIEKFSKPSDALKNCGVGSQEDVPNETIWPTPQIDVEYK